MFLCFLSKSSYSVSTIVLHANATCKFHSVAFFYLHSVLNEILVTF